MVCVSAGGTEDGTSRQPDWATRGHLCDQHPPSLGKLLTLGTQRHLLAAVLPSAEVLAERVEGETEA